MFKLYVPNGSGGSYQSGKLVGVLSLYGPSAGERGTLLFFEKLFVKLVNTGGKGVVHRSFCRRLVVTHLHNTWCPVVSSKIQVVIVLMQHRIIIWPRRHQRASSVVVVKIAQFKVPSSSGRFAMHCDVLETAVIPVEIPKRAVVGDMHLDVDFFIKILSVST